MGENSFTSPYPSHRSNRISAQSIISIHLMFMGVSWSEMCARRPRRRQHKTLCLLRVQKKVSKKCHYQLFATLVSRAFWQIAYAVGESVALEDAIKESLLVFFIFSIAWAFESVAPGAHGQIIVCHTHNEELPPNDSPSKCRCAIVRFASFSIVSHLCFRWCLFASFRANFSIFIQVSACLFGNSPRNE